MIKIEFLGIDANQMAVMRGTLDNGEILIDEWDAECLRDAIRNHAYAHRFEIAAVCDTALSAIVAHQMQQAENHEAFNRGEGYIGSDGEYHLFSEMMWNY